MACRSCSPSNPAVVEGRGLQGVLETCAVLNCARAGLVPAGEGKGGILAEM